MYVQFLNINFEFIVCTYLKIGSDLDIKHITILSY